MDIYKTLITEYHNRHKRIKFKRSLGLNVTLPNEIPDDLATRYRENSYSLCVLSDNFTSKQLKGLAELSKELYGVDYIGYPELTTLNKAYISFPDYELNDEQMNFIFECIRYIYDNYEHELP